MRYIIPDMSINPSKNKVILRAKSYCKVSECAGTDCFDCLFDTDDWNSDKEAQLIEWEQSHET